MTSILIVDDNDNVRQRIRNLLTDRHGIEVCGEADNGRQAVDLALHLRPDIIILDVVMPGLNGIEVAGVLKTSLPSTKIVLFTMYGDYIGSKVAQAAGIDLVLPKPDGLTSLFNALDSLLTASGKPHPHLRNQAPDAAALQAALHESEDRFRATLEQTAVGMAHLSAEGQWLCANQKLCDLVGYTMHELMDLTFQEITHPDDLIDDLAQAKRLAAGEIDRYSMHKRYIRKDGKILPARLTVDAVRDTGGKLKYCVRVIEDATALEEAQKQLSQSFRPDFWS